MKPFKLNVVLQQRQIKKDEAQKRLADAQTQKDTVQNIYTTKQRDLTTLNQDIRRLQDEGIVVHELISFEQRTNYLQEELIKIRKNLKTKEKIVADQRQHLIECARQHKIMEELRDKQNRAYRQFLDKKEAAMLDEIAVVRHGKEQF